MNTTSLLMKSLKKQNKNFANKIKNPKKCKRRKSNKKVKAKKNITYTINPVMFIAFYTMLAYYLLKIFLF